MNFLTMESIEFRDTITQGNYIGYVKEYYSKLPKITNYVVDKEKCLRIPMSLYLDSIVYFKTGILVSHDVNFAESNTIKIKVFKSIESIQVDSNFFSDKLSNR